MKFLGLILKLALSVGLLVALAPRLDWPRVADLLLESRTLAGIGLAVIVLCVQSALAALRQTDIVVLLGDRITLLHSLRVWLSGLFISQVLVTFIAGDVVRSVQLWRGGLPRRKAAQAVVLDRIIGLTALLMLVVASTPFILMVVEDHTMRASLIVLAGISTFVCIGFFAAGFAHRLVQWLLEQIPWKLIRHKLVEILVDLLSISRFLFHDPARAFRIFGLSVLMHMLNFICVVLIARCIGVAASLWMVGLISIPVMLLAMLPISLAGWGVRETAMIVGLGLVHVPADLSVAISVSFGLGLLAASLPGVVALLYSPVSTPSIPVAAPRD